MSYGFLVKNKREIVGALEEYNILGKNYDFRCIDQLNTNNVI